MTLTILTAALAIANSFAQLHATPDYQASHAWMRACTDDDPRLIEYCAERAPVGKTLEAAMAETARCNTPTSWAENLGYPHAAGPYRAVCGTASGHEASSNTECQALAELHWNVAESAGLNADAEWEDAFAACEAGQ